ncbi:hypothetical protein GCM10020331_012790 [Ectobacillus funiculus]
MSCRVCQIPNEGYEGIMGQKNEGIQAHHIIQSFKPGEVTPEQANEIGQELAKEIAKGHEAVVYTHTDKDHVHNHIIINSVNYENGRKYNASKEELYRIREVSDRLCQERNLSVVKGYTAPTRYTLAEKNLCLKRVKTVGKMKYVKSSTMNANTPRRMRILSTV